MREEYSLIIGVAVIIVVVVVFIILVVGKDVDGIIVAKYLENHAFRTDYILVLDNNEVVYTDYSTYYIAQIGQRYKTRSLLNVVLGRE